MFCEKCGNNITTKDTDELCDLCFYEEKLEREREKEDEAEYQFIQNEFLEDDIEWFTKLITEAKNKENENGDF